MGVIGVSGVNYKKFMINSERYLPSAFNSDLTIIEKFNRLAKHMQTYTDLTDEMLIKWNEVYRWITNEGLNETVKDFLNLWLDNGIIAGIINEEIFKDINNDITNNKETINLIINDLNELKNGVKNELENFEEYLNNEILEMENKIEIEKLTNYKSGNHKSITYETFNNGNVIYHMTRIPKKDEKGTIEIKHYIPPSHMTGEEFSKLKNCSLIINASRWNTTNNEIYGVQIVDGTIYNDKPHTDNYILAFNRNGDMKHYAPETKAQTILNDGFNNAVTGFYPLIENSKKTTYHIGKSYGWDSKNPRQVIGKMKNGDSFVFTVEGRIGSNEGFTYDEMQNVLLSHGVESAFDLDGGGSTQTIVNGNKINVSSDRGNSATNSRRVADFIYIENPMGISDLENDLTIISEKLSSVVEMVNNFNDVYKGFLRFHGDERNTQGIEVYKNGKKESKYFFTPERFSMWDYDEGKTMFSISAKDGFTHNGNNLGTLFSKTPITWNIDEVNKTGVYWCAPSTIGNAYGNISHGMIHFEIGEKDSLQFSIPYSSGSERMKIRRKDSTGKYQGWREI